DHLAFSCDVAKEHDVQNTFEEMEKHLGRVNFLVNAAGINRDNLLVRTKTEDMVSQLHTNLLGSMLTCKAAVRTMIRQQGGLLSIIKLINLGFCLTFSGFNLYLLEAFINITEFKSNVTYSESVYSASKGGLVGFSRALAKEVARKKIRVNVVAPAKPLFGTLVIDICIEQFVK
ncbi:reductase, partial [Saguinus oedipus]